MKVFFVYIFLLATLFCSAQPVNQYFEKIRTDEAALTAFFNLMPKGGDLHHHYSGSVYPETLLEHAIANNFYLNRESMTVVKEKPSVGKWEQFSTIQQSGNLEQVKEQIIQQWSIKNFNHLNEASNTHFFSSFEKFKAANDDSFAMGLMELKNRAVSENCSYIETQLNTMSTTISTTNFEPLNDQLRKLQITKNEKAVFQLLDSIYVYLIKQNITKDAQEFNADFVEKLHDSLKIDDDKFTMRFQNYVLRFMEPVDLFKQLVLAFISANKSAIIDGVNIVSPENGDTALQDYWLHMIMYKYCHNRFPKVRYSMHAGELTMNLVKPEELKWHIRSAVYTAKANRIGHGVAIAYEDSSYDLLRYMARQKIAVEINLASNAFILNIKDSRHPILLYKSFGVPIVLSTDDAGILRTTLTEQYVLLAKKYTAFSYSDIKNIVYNGIRYSFIEDENVKKKLLKNLDERFRVFESTFYMEN
ncbi:MAG: hypothetical protein Q8K64_09790 [Sediminibacterium sp.]|nr:MAG: adenosine [Chitinophagaceae bacterium]MDP1843698.1 hypothetical protein [Sediminibacterium sp.]